MKKILLCCFIILSIVVRAQQPDAALCYNTLAVKAKVLPWMLVGAGMNYTLGIEYGFKKVHAVGIDLTYSDFGGEHDVYDSAKGQMVAGPRMLTVTRAVLLNYRRYLDFHNTILERPAERVFSNNFLPYAGAFLRGSKTDNHPQTGYITNQVSYDEWQYSGGVLFGVICNFVDVNAGPFYKTKFVRDVEMEWGAPSRHRYSTSNFGLRVGVDVYLVVKKKSAHRSAQYANTWEREYCESVHGKRQ